CARRVMVGLSVMRLSPVCALLSLALLPALAHAVPQSARQRECILAVLSRTAALAAAQGKQVTACAGSATGAVDPACVAADFDGKIADRTADLRDAVIDRCQQAPEFGTDPRPVPVATAAGTVHVRGLAADLLGPGTDAAGVAAGTRCRRA